MKKNQEEKKNLELGFNVKKIVLATNEKKKIEHSHTLPVKKEIKNTDPNNVYNLIEKAKQLISRNNKVIIYLDT